MPTFETILGTVADVYQVTPSEITSDARPIRIAEARHCVAYLSYHRLGLDQQAIGRRLNRGHSNVGAGIRKIAGLLQVKDAATVDRLREIERRLAPVSEDPQIANQKS